MGWHLFHRHRYQKTGPKKRKQPLQKTHTHTHDRETHKLKQASPRAARVKQGLDSQASERRDRRLHVPCLGASTTRRAQALASDQAAGVPVRPPSQSFSSVGASVLRSHWRHKTDRAYRILSQGSTKTRDGVFLLALGEALDPKLGPTRCICPWQMKPRL